jgi:TetR/AcrR family transcriptional repressor of nem operon
MPRPREYDEAELISLAMNVFWSRGYRGTSIDELVTETGVSRASLYAAYPDKRSLFIVSIKRYLDDVVDGNLRRLNEIEPPAEAVRQFFLRLVDAPAARLRRGCLLTNSAAELGLKDKQAAALIRDALQRVEDALHKQLIEARRAGALAAEVDPRGYARQLITLFQGIRVMARVGVSRDMLKDAVTAALSPIKTPRQARRTPDARAPKRSRMR